ncbi:tyrosine-type recombinase/integrase [Paracidovorax avenae]
MDLPWLDGVQRLRTPKRIPSVLTALLARLLYGTGMRLMEGLRLRVKDMDFDRGVVVVRQAKGDNDRHRECGAPLSKNHEPSHRHPRPQPGRLGPTGRAGLRMVRPGRP